MVEIKKNDKVYTVIETKGRWLIQNKADKNAPVLKLSRGICYTKEELEKLIMNSTMF